MSSVWQTKKLEEVCDIVNGSTPLRSNKEFWANGDVAWFTIEDIREQGRVIKFTKQKITKKALGKTSVRLLPPKSVLLCCTASVGEYAISEIQLTTNQQFNGLVVKNKEILDPVFLFYFSSTLKGQLLGLSGKTTIDFIPISRLKEIEIPLPSLPEQKRIIKILDQVFEATAKAKENVEKNLQNTKELFESYLQGVFYHHKKGWEETLLQDVCLIESKLIDPRKAEFLDLIHVGAGNIEIKTGKLINLKTSREEKLISGKFLFDKSMVLYSKIRPYLMKVVRPEFDGLCSADIYPLSPIYKKITRDYLFYLLLTQNFTQYAIKGSGRAGMPKVNREHLFVFSFFLPPISEQKSIVKKLDALSVETKKLEAIYKQKLADLEELKKSVLKRAFAGEL